MKYENLEQAKGLCKQINSLKEAISWCEDDKNYVAICGKNGYPLIDSSGGRFSLIEGIGHLSDIYRLSVKQKLTDELEMFMEQLSEL